MIDLEAIEEARTANVYDHGAMLRLRDTHLPALIAEVRRLRGALEAVYDGLMPDGTLAPRAFAEVMHVLGKVKP